MPVSVEMTPRYVRLARKLAADRAQSFEGPDDWYDENKAQGWGHESERRHFIGLLGEMAFAEYYGLQIDTETYTRTDEGVDFRVRIDTEDFGNGTVEVDVKSSPVNDPQLFVTKGQVDADYYVLCRIPQDALEADERATIEMLGGATKEMVLSREPVQSDNYGHYYYSVSPEYLLEMPRPEDIHFAG